MTQLLDGPLASASTLYPRRQPPSPTLEAAEDFYIHGIDQGVRQVQIQVSGPDGSLRRTWLASYMEEQVTSLLRLPHGWDGRRACRVTERAIGSGIELVFAVAGDLSLPPQIFPLPDGGIQMEWHAGESVEIEIDPAGDAHVLVTDEGGHIVLNEEIIERDGSLMWSVRKAVEQLSTRIARSH
jgi:hypothetical protein